MRIFIALTVLFTFASLANAERVIRSRTVTTTVERGTALALNGGIRSGFRGERFDAFGTRTNDIYGVPSGFSRSGSYGSSGLIGLTSGGYQVGSSGYAPSLAYAAPPPISVPLSTGYSTPIPTYSASYSTPAPTVSDPSLEARIARLEQMYAGVSQQVAQVQYVPAPTYYVQYGVPYYASYVSYGAAYYGSGYSGIYGTAYYGTRIPGFRTGFYGGRGFVGFRGGFVGREFR